MCKRNHLLAAARVVAIAASFAAVASTASARSLSSSVHIISLPSSHPGNLVNNVQNQPNIANNFPGAPPPGGGSLMNKAKNQPNIAKNFPTNPATSGSSAGNGGWGGKYGNGSHGYGWIGGFASNGDPCLEYRKIFDESGRYLGRQLINVCQ